MKCAAIAALSSRTFVLQATGMPPTVAVNPAGVDALGYPPRWRSRLLTTPASFHPERMGSGGPGAARSDHPGRAPLGACNSEGVVSYQTLAPSRERTECQSCGSASFSQEGAHRRSRRSRRARALSSGLGSGKGSAQPCPAIACGKVAPSRRAPRLGGFSAPMAVCNAFASWRVRRVMVSQRHAGGYRRTVADLGTRERLTWKLWIDTERQALPGGGAERSSKSSSRGAGPPSMD
jgi:hypothetical protein